MGKRFQAQTITAGDLDAARLQQVHQRLVSRFPAADERLTRELASVLAFCGQPDASTKILTAIPKGDTNPPLQSTCSPCCAARRPAGRRSRSRR